MSILLEELTKIYKQADFEVVALKQVSLSVSKGEFISVIGPSGSGKTTLLNLIGGLDRPSAGKLLVFENNLARLTWDELANFRRDHVSYVFQSGNLNPILSVKENIDMSLMIRGMDPKKTREKIAEILHLTHLEKRSSHRPNQLSAGEQQRAALAMAVINDPKLLILDEPTGNLDLESTQDVLAILRQIHAQTDTTIVLVTHNPLVANISDRIVSLFDGRLSSIKEPIQAQESIVPPYSLFKEKSVSTEKQSSYLHHCSCQSQEDDKDQKYNFEFIICHKCHGLKIKKVG